MAESTKIEWADHTFSPWVGCQKVSSACDNCYAESWGKRSGLVEWGPKAHRRRTSPATWANLRKWNAAAEKAGRRETVFPSLCDPFDNAVPPEWRKDFYNRIRETPNLVYLLLTKRPGNIVKMCEAAGGLPANVGLGTTAEDQERANDRVPKLLDAAARLKPLFTFLSCEPLLGPLRLDTISAPGTLGRVRALCQIDQVIVGGESGPRARPMHPDWPRSLLSQCQAAETAFLFKQWGEWRPSGGWIDGALEPGSHGISRTGEVARAGDLMCGHTSGAEWNGYAIIRRVGKSRAGRLLDGREWNEFPEVLTCPK